MPSTSGSGRSPDGEHHRQPRLLEPEPAEVVVGRRILEGALQRGVADQQLRIRLLVERADLGRREQHLRQHDRGGALGRDRHRADAAERHPGHELDRVDRALGRDAEPRQQPERVGVARVLDRRDRGDVELSVEQEPVELGRNARDLLDVVLEPVEDRRHVDVGDAAELDHPASVTGFGSLARQGLPTVTVQG